MSKRPPGKSVAGPAKTPVPETPSATATAPRARHFFLLWIIAALALARLAMPSGRAMARMPGRRPWRSRACPWRKPSMSVPPPVRVATPPRPRLGKVRNTPAPCSMRASKRCSAISTMPVLRTPALRRPFSAATGSSWSGPMGRMASWPTSRRRTFGVEPLQQYLIQFPGGRLRALGIAWDSRPKQAGGQRWFHLYPEQSPKSGSPLHWTGIEQNWNYQCADCHSSNLHKGYDAASDSFKTTATDRSVGCESCHGPGSQHITGPKKRMPAPRRLPIKAWSSN